jgi:cobalamin-dependent methionine synthase I
MTKKTPRKNTNYEVGRGRPPEKTKWKKGQSGNPKGRPRAKVPDLPDLLNAMVEVTEKGKKRKVPMFEVSLRTLCKRGIEDGNVSALIDLISLFVQYGVIKPIPPELEQTTVEVPEEIYEDFIALLNKIDAEKEGKQ